MVNKLTSDPWSHHFATFVGVCAGARLCGILKTRELKLNRFNGESVVSVTSDIFFLHLI